MKRDFLGEFKAAIRKIDVIVERPVAEVELFNIHKRSLPVGVDKPVFYNVTREAAKKLFDVVLKTKMIDSVIYYYDLIPIGTIRDVFWNDTTICEPENA